MEGKINIVLADGLYVDSLNLKVRIQNQIRRLAVFNNPVFYKKKRMKQFTGYDFRTVYLGEDIDGYIHLPRGLKDELIKQCKNSDIEYVIDDKREDGKPLRVKFIGELRFEQSVAAESLLQYDIGILNAATAFGKTVVCAYLIAKRKTNTLILIENTSLMQQWIETLEQFLDIDEMPPEYTTKTGRIKRRTSVIGTIKGGTDKLTGMKERRILLYMTM